MKVTTTHTRHMATFLLEVALGQERLKQRISRWLAKERDERRLSQLEMAQLVEISYRQYQRYESAESLPRWRQLERMAEVLGTDIGHVLAIAETPTETTDEEEPSLQEGLATLREEVAALRQEWQEYRDEQMRSRPAG
jgi:transcriptional regulator with XRE-family HTH domain